MKVVGRGVGSTGGEQGKVGTSASGSDELALKLSVALPDWLKNDVDLIVWSVGGERDVRYSMAWSDKGVQRSRIHVTCKSDEIGESIGDIFAFTASLATLHHIYRQQVRRTGLIYHHYQLSIL